MCCTIALYLSAFDVDVVDCRYRVWASTCPFVARFTMIGIAISWFLGLFLRDLDRALRSGIQFTIMNFEGTGTVSCTVNVNVVVNLKVRRTDVAQDRLLQYNIQYSI